MAEQAILDKAYHVVLQRFIDTGRAPHYTEMAAELGMPPEAGRQLLHDLMEAGLPAIWLHPGTDHIASFAPFSNLATQYRITVQGTQKWFGQGAFESLAVCWLFPGKTVRIDAPCLDCGEPIVAEVRDGEVVRAEPEGIVGIANHGFAGPSDEWAFRGSGMNFFRSEEHMRNWAQLSSDPTISVTIMPLAGWMDRFSQERFQGRLRPDYVSWHTAWRAQQRRGVLYRVVVPDPRISLAGHRGGPRPSQAGAERGR